MNDYPLSFWKSPNYNVQVQLKINLQAWNSTPSRVRHISFFYNIIGEFLLVRQKNAETSVINRIRNSHHDVWLLDALHSNRLPINHCFDCSDIDTSITYYTKLYQRYPIDVLWLYEGFDSVLQILIYQCRRWIKFILKPYWRTDYYRWILCKTQSVNIAVSAFSSLKW